MDVHAYIYLCICVNCNFVSKRRSEPERQGRRRIWKKENNIEDVKKNLKVAFFKLGDVLTPEHRIFVHWRPIQIPGEYFTFVPVK